MPTEAADVIVCTADEGSTWETPRAPFEVEVDCQARVPSSSGRQGEGTPFFANPPEAPLKWAIGDGSAPPGGPLQLNTLALKHGGTAVQLAISACHALMWLALRCSSRQIAMCQYLVLLGSPHQLSFESCR